MLGFVALLFLLAAMADPYTGPERCGACHAEQYAKQSASHHASALRPIAASPLPQRLRERPLAERNGATFEYAPEDGALRVTASRAGAQAAGILQWAFGSGAQGMTPVGRVDGVYFEHRVSWYERAARPNVTLGHPAASPPTALAALGQMQTADAIERCFGCHATGVSPGPDLSTMRPGVSCERCHGPGAPHAAKPAKTNIQNPGKLEASRQVAFCGECHRLPVRPSAMPEIDDPLSVRFAPVGLMASRCYQKSGRLTCLTCHDPHANAETSPAYYAAKCAECHSPKAAGNCPRSAGCLTCHMPRTRPVPDLVFTDHRIRTPTVASSTALGSVEAAVASNDWNRAGELLERIPARNAHWHILSSKVYDGLNDPTRAVEEAEAALALEPRNEAAHLQLGQIFLGRNTPDAAAEIFSEALVLFPDSQMLRLGRGLAYKELGRAEEGEKDLRQCLAKDPSLAIAFDALATILIHARRYDEARELAGSFRKTSPRDYRGPYFVAAALEGEKQTGEDIEALLRHSLNLNPNFAAAWALLGKVILRSERVADAVGPLERAVALRPDLVPARMQLAEAYRKLGRDSDAAREFQTIRELNDKERQPPPRLQYRRGRL